MRLAFISDIHGNLPALEAVLFGHTHKPWTRTVDGRVLINTGSVGRPKDGDPRASYALVDVGPQGVDVAFPRVRYDVGPAAEAIADAGLPDELGTFLRTGGAFQGGLAVRERPLQPTRPAQGPC